MLTVTNSKLSKHDWKQIDAESKNLSYKQLAEKFGTSAQYINTGLSKYRKRLNQATPTDSELELERLREELRIAKSKITQLTNEIVALKNKPDIEIPYSKSVIQNVVMQTSDDAIMTIKYFLFAFTRKWGEDLPDGARKVVFKIPKIKEFMDTRKLSFEHMRSFIDWFFENTANDNFKGNFGILHSTPTWDMYIASGQVNTEADASVFITDKEREEHDRAIDAFHRKHPKYAKYAPKTN